MSSSLVVHIVLAFIDKSLLHKVCFILRMLVDDPSEWRFVNDSYPQGNKDKHIIKKYQSEACTAVLLILSFALGRKKCHRSRGEILVNAVVICSSQGEFSDIPPCRQHSDYFDWKLERESENLSY